MQMKKMGKTGFEISEIGMGCIQITRLERKVSTQLVREVVDLGINWFDTAQAYFDSEERLGEALSGIRDSVHIITKSGAKETDKLRTHIEQSLSKLRTDYIDVLCFHGAGAVDTPDFAAPGGLLETAESFVRQGKIRHLGFSAHRPVLALKALEYDQLVVGMVPANHISREFIDGDFMARARDKEVAVLAMKPFGGGRLESPGACLRFLKTYPDLFPCIGIEKISEMADNIKVWESNKVFADRDRDVLEKQRLLLGDKFCRMCGYCLPCPEGIPIPQINMLKVLGKQMARDKFITEQRDEDVAKAELCTECRQCVARCPYDLDIPEMLKDNVELYHTWRNR